MGHIKTIDNKLVTPIVNYENGKQRVKVFSTVHIAVPSYYEYLQKEVDSLPRGYFEGVGKSDRKANVPFYKRPFKNSLKTLTELYIKLADDLGYVTEHTMTIPKTWKNADFSLDEFLAEAPLPILVTISSLKKLYFKMSDKLEPGELKKIAREVLSEEKSEHSEIAKLMEQYLMKGLLAEERNERLFETIEHEFSNPNGDFGIKYGAAHLPGIDEHLRSKGFEEVNRRWIPAWEL